MELKARYYRALPIDSPGNEDEILELARDETALIGMHCWNIGCPDGPPVDVDYCVGMGWPQATAEAGRIMAEVIRPAMDQCRRQGVAVCHVESDWMDHQYPQVPSRRQPDQKPALPPMQQSLLDRAHGPEYLARSPLARMRRAAIASPEGDESLFFYTDQLDAWLKDRKIRNLIYTGFAADMCLLGAEGGARPMLGLGYRCILIREGTVGVETPETFPERLVTRYAIQRFEWQVGWSCSLADLADALDSP
ncbi:cysteine hydrolase family protein [Candidatus Latescibacterota bacterium]